MIATTFDIAMFLSRGGDCVQGIARVTTTEYLFQTTLLSIYLHLSTE
jgi:hypothetical protein